MEFKISVSLMTKVSTDNAFDFSEQVAAQYLEKHGIPQLMVELGACIIDKRPRNLSEFLIQELQARIGRSEYLSMNSFLNVPI